jgi:hypothetical protein
LDITNNLRPVSWEIERYKAENKTVIAMLLGNTLSNFDDPEKQLKTIYDSLPKGGYLLFGVQTGPDPSDENYESKIKEIEEQYGANVDMENNPIDDFLKIMTRTLKIPDDSIELKTKYSPYQDKGGVVKMFYEVVSLGGLSVPHYLEDECKLNDQDIPHKDPEECVPLDPIIFEKGEHIPIAFSRKYHPSYVIELAKSLGENNDVIFNPERDPDYMVVLIRKGEQS